MLVYLVVCSIYSQIKDVFSSVPHTPGWQQQLRVMLIDSNRGRGWGQYVTTNNASVSCLLFLCFLCCLFDSISILKLSSFCPELLLLLFDSFCCLPPSPTTSSHFSLNLPIFNPFLTQAPSLGRYTGLTCATIKWLCQSWRRERKKGGRKKSVQVISLITKLVFVGFTGSTGRGQQLELLQQTTLTHSLRRCVCVCDTPVRP